MGTAIIVARHCDRNTAVPAVIRPDIPWHRMSMAGAIYTAALNAGSMATSRGTAPLTAAIGWKRGLAVRGINDRRAVSEFFGHSFCGQAFAY